MSYSAVRSLLWRFVVRVPRWIRLIGDTRLRLSQRRLGEVMCTRQFDVLGCFVHRSFSAAAQANDEMNWICEAVKVSGTVTSQTRGLPRVQGTRVAPSGLFPSCLRRPIGSLLAGMWAFFTALQMMSLSCEWRMWRGVLIIIISIIIIIIKIIIIIIIIFIIIIKIIIIIIIIILIIIIIIILTSVLLCSANMRIWGTEKSLLTEG